MKSLSFVEFIRSYNFIDDYSKVEALVDPLSNTDSGILQYKDSKYEDCY